MSNDPLKQLKNDVGKIYGTGRTFGECIVFAIWVFLVWSLISIYLFGK